MEKVAEIIDTPEAENPNCYEDYLLKKVSLVELSNRKQAEVIDQMQKENFHLKKRVEGLNKANSDFESKLKVLGREEEAVFDRFGGDLREANETIQTQRATICDLEKANEMAYHQLNKMEINFFKIESEFKDKIIKLKKNVQDQEKSLEEAEKTISALKTELELKTGEVNESKHKLNGYRKDYNKIRQINKSYETSIKGLKEEKNRIEERATWFETEYLKIKEAMQNVLQEIQKTKKSSKMIQTMIESFSNQYTEDREERARERHFDSSPDSLAEATLEIQRDINKIEKEFRGEPLGLKGERQIEEDLESMAKPDLQRTVVPRKAFNHSKKSKETGISFSINQQVSGINVVFDEKRKKSTLRAAKKLNLSRASVEKIRNETKEQIDLKIKTRSIKRENNILFMSSSHQSYASITPKSDSQAEQRFAEKFLKNTGEVVMKEISKFDSFVLSKKEKENFISAWICLNDFGMFISWVLRFFENKFKSEHVTWINTKAENGRCSPRSNFRVVLELDKNPGQRTHRTAKDSQESEEEVRRAHSKDPGHQSNHSQQNEPEYLVPEDCAASKVAEHLPVHGRPNLPEGGRRQAEHQRNLARVQTAKKQHIPRKCAAQTRVLCVSKRFIKRPAHPQKSPNESGLQVQ